MTDWNSIFEYDETSLSCLRWKIDRYSGRYYKIQMVAKGDMAGVLSEQIPTRYYTVMYDNTKYKVHRVIWEMHNGKIPDGMVIDHIDNNQLNNKISNLRCVSQRQNMHNQVKRKSNSSGTTGVSFNKIKNAWICYWQDINGKQQFKSFSIKNHGDTAQRLAINYRERMIAQLNSVGEDYTNNHGVMERSKNDSI